MSDGLRFVSMFAPDVLETAGRVFNNSPSQKPRKPRLRLSNRPLSLGKKDPAMALNNPKPEEILASLDTTLLKFVEAAGSPEKQATVLIKIGSYKVELEKYAPMLEDADLETAKATLAEWFAAGDGELKKALVNRATGAEDFPLLKMALAEEGPEYELAKMLDEAPTNAIKMGLLQKIGFYSMQVSEMLGRGELLKIDPAEIDKAITAWIEDGDGTHKALKKAISASAQARQRANTPVGENEAVDEKAGNAATHAGSKLHDQNDRTYVPRSTGEGAGPRKEGSIQGPGQANGESPSPGSGPNDTGDGGVNPSIKIRRKGTTGGLGSVAGADASGVNDAGTHADQQNKNPDDKRKKKKFALDKAEDLGTELVKILPDDAIGFLAKHDAAGQVTICESAAQDAADLMAWSMQQDPNKLQKNVLDAAITDWLSSDVAPEAVAMKKWVAEALASAEEIPLELGKAIMAWEPPTKAGLRVRQRAAA